MQDIFRKIFNMAARELPDKYQTFHGEDAILYRGFKISKTKKGYSWKDTRYSDFYEPVDPKITEKVLEKGFCVTLNEVMLHNDKDKILNLLREIEVKDALISFWVKESTKIWTNYNKKRLLINKDTKTTDEEKKVKRDLIRKRYEKKKTLYQKKRGVISEEREALKADLKFFESRVNLYNN